jgi:hypothetical protein
MSRTKEEQKKYYQKNKEKIKKYARNWRVENKEKLKRYFRERYITHQEERRKSAREYAATHRKERCETERQYNRKNRAIVINHYGGRCVFCGNTNLNHLTIDHINNDGAKHRKTVRGSRIYVWLIKNNFPSGFQVLCWNHNAEKQYYGTMTLVT